MFSMKTFFKVSCFHLLVLVSSLKQREIIVQDTDFILRQTGEKIVLVGPNVVVKGPPYLPDVTGNSYCIDHVDSTCSSNGACSSCTTFNQADIDHIKSMGWNMIRLGVVWAGAQSKDTNSLDADFLHRLHQILNLTDTNGIYVMLDNHGDMVSSAGCGNGAPMWFSYKAAPDLIGKPLKTNLPYSLVANLNVENVNGYEYCGVDEELYPNIAPLVKWAAYAGDPNYNLLNECCLAMNSPNPGGLGYTTINQATMDYMILDGPGRDDFVRYWRLMAEAVVDHPSAFAVEFMNEPMSIRRTALYDTWRVAGEAVLDVIPDMSLSVSDVGEGAIVPAWLANIDAGVFISPLTLEWIKRSKNVFYAWHWYGEPSSIDDAVANVQAISKSWNVPTFLTEFQSCDAWEAAAKANISHSYWHYSSYCTTGPSFGNLSVPDETFGACILGWDEGDSSKTC